MPKDAHRSAAHLTGSRCSSQDSRLLQRPALASSYLSEGPCMRYQLPLGRLTWITTYWSVPHSGHVHGTTFSGLLFGVWRPGKSWKRKAR